MSFLHLNWGRIIAGDPTLHTPWYDSEYDGWIGPGKQVSDSDTVDDSML